MIRVTNFFIIVSLLVLISSIFFIFRHELHLVRQKSHQTDANYFKLLYQKTYSHLTNNKRHNTKITTKPTTQIKIQPTTPMYEDVPDDQKFNSDATVKQGLMFNWELFTSTDRSFPTQPPSTKLCVMNNVCAHKIINPDAGHLFIVNDDNDKGANSGNRTTHTHTPLHTPTHTRDLMFILFRLINCSTLNVVCNDIYVNKPWNERRSKFILSPIHPLHQHSFCCHLFFFYC